VKHKVQFRPAAAADLENIYDFIARDNPLNAFAFIQRIRRRCEEIAEFPEAAPLHEDLKPGLRLLAFEKRVIIAYLVEDHVVSIGRILYGGRDLRALIGKME
jgi:toxin ParE1/3/4